MLTSGNIWETQEVRRLRLFLVDDGQMSSMYHKQVVGVASEEVFGSQTKPGGLAKIWWVGPGGEVAFIEKQSAQRGMEKNEGTDFTKWCFLPQAELLFLKPQKQGKCSLVTAQLG